VRNKYLILWNNLVERVSTKTAKDYLFLTVSNIAIRPIQFVKGIVVAKYISPETYGLYRTGELITMLNKFGNLGFNSTASREVGTALGEKNQRKANYFRLSCYSGEFSLAIILLVLGLTSSLTVISKNVLFLVIITSTFTLFLSKIHGIYTTEAIIQREFKLISISSVVGSAVSSILTILLVPFYGIYAVLLFPVAQELIILFIFWRKINLNTSIKIFDKSISSVFKTSFHFSLSTISYGGYKYAERLILVSQLGTKALGFFSFSSLFAEQATQFVFMMVKVRKQKLFEELGKGNYTAVHKIVKRETNLFLILSILSFPIIGLFLYYFIPLYLPKWVEALNASYLMLILIPLKVLGSYESIVIVSPIVNKQLLLSIGMFISTLFLVIISFLFAYLGVLTLEKFIVINLISSAIYVSIINIAYYKYFYLSIVCCK
jgi:O-antigen/teichoic acid export membrane protein